MPPVVRGDADRVPSEPQLVTWADTIDDPLSTATTVIGGRLSPTRLCTAGFGQPVSCSVYGPTTEYSPTSLPMVTGPMPAPLMIQVAGSSASCGAGSGEATAVGVGISPCVI